MTHRHWPLSLSLVLLAVANLLANRLLPGADVAIGVVLTLLLLLVAYRAGMGPGSLGLARSTWAAGLRWGSVVVLLVAAAYAVAWFLPAVREALTPSAQSWPQALGTALVVIPLATAIPEELAFRGVLLALLQRHVSTRWATVVSSALFALWHLLPSLSGSAANVAADEAAASAGVGTAGAALRVAGTLLLTFCAGVFFCELRRRSDSLLAPVAAHWSINGLGVLFLMLV